MAIRATVVIFEVPDAVAMNGKNMWTSSAILEVATQQGVVREK